jgi:molybdopterin-guanine dinucleotide biosynthesis adapter protein
MIPIVSIVGKSDSGKTTLIEKLVPELVRRGYRIATVKHDVHGFEVDREGKDSWRHKQAGAHTVVISSPNKVALIRDVEKDLTLEEIRETLIRDVDLILSEGYKKDVQSKVEIFRKEMHQELLCGKEDQLVAIVSNRSFDIGIPCFDLEDMKGLSDLIEKDFLKLKKENGIALKVDGKIIPLNPFVRNFLAKAIRGMIISLKGCAAAKRIEIRVEEGEDREWEKSATGVH